VLVLAVAALGVLYYRSAHREVRVVRASIPPPENTEYHLLSYAPGAVKVSPDGRRLVFAAKGGDQQPHLWIRDLDATEARPLAGTEGAAYPFWAPDGRSIGFFADGKLKKIRASGGPTSALCDAVNGKGGSWNQDGIIVFAPDYNSGIYRVPAAGGEPTPLTSPDTLKSLRSHRHPTFLPDGRRFLFLAKRLDPEGEDSVRVGSLDGDEDSALMPGESNIAYASGFLLFVHESVLMARPFDPKHVRFTGEAFPVAERIRYLAGARLGVFSASQNDVLVYQYGGEKEIRELVWMDRNGERLGTLGDSAAYEDVRISPNGERVAAVIRDPHTETMDIWIYEVAEGIRNRFTFDRGNDLLPVWAPDGESVIFASARGGHLDLYRKSVSGTETGELLLESQETKFPVSWSPDGEYLLYETSEAVWVLSLSGDEQPIPILQSERNANGAVFSPCGEWIAFSSDESGRYEIYVTRFPELGRKWQVSVDGGYYPMWIAGTGEIHYTSLGGVGMAVEVHTDGARFRAGAPVVLFDVSQAEGGDVAVDGQSALLIFPVDRSTSDPLTVVLNWTAGLDWD
jgi:Tol biopolymer transport system component